MLKTAVFNQKLDLVKISNSNINKQNIESQENIDLKDELYKVDYLRVQQKVSILLLKSPNFNFYSKWYNKSQWPKR